MGQAIHFSRVAIGVTVQVPEELVEANIGYFPSVLGDHLAEQVLTHVEDNGVGYYPALDYFRDHTGALDPALLALTDEVAAFCITYARREFRRRLSRVFSSVQVQQAQCMAFNLPPVRPSHKDAVERLARHYSPNAVKLELVLSSIEKQSFEREEAMASLKLTRWARGPFREFRILGTRRLAD